MSLKLRARQLGQGMTEYIIIVALIAISAIVVYNLFGSTVRQQVGGMAAELGGGTADAAAISKAGTDSQTAGKVSHTLSNYQQAEGSN